MSGRPPRILAVAAAVAAAAGLWQGCGDGDAPPGRRGDAGAASASSAAGAGPGADGAVGQTDSAGGRADTAAAGPGGARASAPPARGAPPPADTGEGTGEGADAGPQPERPASPEREPPAPADPPDTAGDGPDASGDGPAATGDALAPPSAAEIVRRAAAAYDSLRSLRAHFRQVLEMRVFDPPRRREGEGTWYQRKPAFLRMDFSDPEGDVIVSDGEHLWLYYPSTHPGQVVRTGLESPERGTAVVDLQGRIFRQAQTVYRPEYRGREEVGGETTHVLELRPRSPETPYRRVRVWVDAETLLVRKLQFHDRSQTVRTITLDDLEPDVTLPDSLFRFEPPPDVEVFRG